MKDILRFGIILTIVALIASGALAWINEITRPRILLQQEIAFNSGLFSVLPGADEGIIEPINEDGDILYYEGYADTLKSHFIGYAFLTLGKGYSSTIQTLVGLDSLMQHTGNWWQYTPSVFARAIAVSEDPPRPELAFWRCPLCSSLDMITHEEGIRCNGCDRLWPLVDGIYDFKIPSKPD